MSIPRGGESVLFRAMTGRVTKYASVRGWRSAMGSRNTKSHGSQKAAWVWLVKFLGGRRPAAGLAPLALLCKATSLFSSWLSASCHRGMMGYVRLTKGRYNVHQLRLYFIGHLRDFFEGQFWTICIFYFPYWLQNRISTSHATS